MAQVTGAPTQRVLIGGVRCCLRSASPTEQQARCHAAAGPSGRMLRPQLRAVQRGPVGLRLTCWSRRCGWEIRE